MASRQEEKEKRRRERLEREEAERRAAARRRRLQYVFGGLLAVAAVAGVVAVIVLTGSGGDSGGTGQPTDASEAAASVKLPAQKTGDMQQAAETAGCKLSNPPIEAANHETKEFKASDYTTNPPTSGNHNPDWYEDGIYEAGNTPRLGMLVHPLEHGRVEVQYKKGTPADTVTKLEALVGENDGYHVLMFENATNMPSAVAATAWGHSLTCPQMNDGVFDAIRTFRERYTDKGPEQVP